MSYQDPNQPGQYSESNQYGGYNPNREQPQPTDPYSNQQYGQNNQQGGYQGNYQGENQQYGQQGQYGQPGSQYGPQGQGANQQYTGYGQPQYGQQGQYGQQQGQYGQQGPYGQQNAFNTGFSTSGIPNNVAAGLSYVLGWITGLIFFFTTDRQNRFVRFNAMQSIIYALIATVYSWILSPLLHAVLIFPFLGNLVTAVIGIVLFIGWIMCMVNAFQGKYFKLPYIGDLAEKYANQNTPSF